MRILAIETSSKSVSVALLDNTDVIIELDSSRDEAQNPPGRTRSGAGANDKLPAGYVRKRGKRGSQTSRIFPPGASALLAPMIKSIIQQSGSPIGLVELVAVTTGPGSFTGLRVGVVTAKALAYSNRAQIIGINTLEAIAAQTAEKLAEECSPSLPKRICPVINAQRQQVFAGRYLASGSLSGQDWRIEESSPNEIVGRESWKKKIGPHEILTGPGLVGVFSGNDLENSAFIVAPENCWSCTASTVGKLAWRKFEAGKRESLSEIEPIYFRPSAAEEVRNAKLNRDNR